MMYLLAPAFVRHGDRSGCQLKAMYDTLKAFPSSPGIGSVDLRHGLYQIKTAARTLNLRQVAIQADRYGTFLSSSGYRVIRVFTKHVIPIIFHTVRVQQ